MSEPRTFPLERERMFDLERTSKLAELFQVPREQRTSKWMAAFFDAVWLASLEVAEPPFFAGPDGFTYLRMHVPTPGKSFPSNSVANLAQLAVDRGAGIAVFASPKAQEPELVLSMGRLDSLLRYDSWRGDPFDLEEIARRAQAATQDSHGMQTIQPGKDEQLLRAAPANTFLPPATAAVLYRHLTEGWKIADPRVALMIVPSMAPSRSLVIGKKMSEFPDPATAARQTRMLLWYLPPERSLVLMPESWSLDSMRPLRDYLPDARQAQDAQAGQTAPAGEAAPAP